MFQWVAPHRSTWEAYWTWCVIKNKKDPMLGEDGDMVDMEGMGDKYDQNILCDFLKHLIKILYEN